MGGAGGSKQPFLRFGAFVNDPPIRIGCSSEWSRLDLSLPPPDRWRWPRGKVSASGRRAPGSKSCSSEYAQYLRACCMLIHAWGQTTSRWCGAEFWIGDTSSGVVLVISRHSR
ncbi:hypothetical protein AVEN_140614-1 [Araneus ventricosus]|uniref:Uncharacterized protein n=1 Tax=Araneus ventricosus TaxID=182803 RepID=A0A4Y2RXA4_ARAVE|nr:hypothetical protein AVEN_119574-1 [Araneus ventricosus]GBN80482.1 hypothetical protein AVEN_140614-1 [Araneus ventricosus]